MVLTLALERVEFLPLGRVTDDTSILTLRSLVFEPLCRWRDGRVEPGLLAAWAHDDDGRAWQFAVRAGATFHDGHACTAEDVAETIGAHLRGVDMFGMPWPYARYLANARITPEGPGMLSISTPEPIADLPEILAEFFVMRAAPDGDMTLGTGPYRVLDHAPRSHALLEAVDRAGAPARIRLIAEPDPQGRQRMVADGAADAATNLERLPNPTARAPGLDWGHAPNTLSVMYYLDCRKGAFAHPAARLPSTSPSTDRRSSTGCSTASACPPRPSSAPSTWATARPRCHRSRTTRPRARAVRPGGRPGRTAPAHAAAHARTRAADQQVVADALARVGIATRIETRRTGPNTRGRSGASRSATSPSSTARRIPPSACWTTRSPPPAGPWWQGFDDPRWKP